MDKVSDNLPKAYFTMLGIGCAVFLVYCVLLFVVYKQTFSGTYQSFTYIVKIIVIVVSVITFMFSIITIVLLIGSTFINSFCEFNKDLLKQTEFSTFFAEYSIELETQELSFLNECIPSNANGDIIKILEIPSSFDQIQDMISGLSRFNNFKTRLSAASENSVTIDQTIKTWTTFRSGNEYSNPTQKSQITTANRLLDCAS